MSRLDIDALFVPILFAPEVRVCINQLLADPSYWIGCPASFGFLSDTRLTTLNISEVAAIVLICTGESKLAFVKDDAILISFAPRLLSPALVIAK